MNVKIDTKEKFREIHLLEPELSANMTDDLVKLLNHVRNEPPVNIVLSIKDCRKMDVEFGEVLTGEQTRFYDAGASFVICEMDTGVEESLEEAGILETMNVAPTLSEAWDIVQMEEIERELLNDWE
ncbi:MAG: anti-anti-sigma factor [Chitinophagaceae bacterium]|jgi:anti-anti-sigma regulatory factor|nr:anti-anti-sigma factor [Chitinophagaceae bacterium]MCU0402948.1 anti-anti-sigma factor [Chitinophagaceae bacterium]